MFRQLLLVLIALFCLNLAVYYSLQSHPSVLAETVSVTASIDTCPFIIIVPENRIPPTGNNSLEIAVQIRTEGSVLPLYTTTVTTDNEGVANLCPVPQGLGSTNFYDIAVKGLSHLNRVFPHQIVMGAGTTLDLRTPVLFAGDSHPTADNYVNSLDISYEITNIYTSDLRADLNRDTIVNSLEFPTLISHLYAYGDD